MLISTSKIFIKQNVLQNLEKTQHILCIMTREFSRCLIDRQIAEKFIFVQNRSERLLILNLFISNL